MYEIDIEKFGISDINLPKYNLSAYVTTSTKKKVIFIKKLAMLNPKQIMEIGPNSKYVQKLLSEGNMVTQKFFVKGKIIGYIIA
jgi:hypothetical protein